MGQDYLCADYLIIDARRIPPSPHLRPWADKYAVLIQSHLSYTFWYIMAMPGPERKIKGISNF